MRLSRYFLPILKETPKEAEIASHRLMLRAGMIRQEGAGIYAWLPLGLRVLHKICAVVREEQNRAGREHGEAPDGPAIGPTLNEGVDDRDQRQADEPDTTDVELDAGVSDTVGQ